MNLKITRQTNKLTKKNYVSVNMQTKLKYENQFNI